MTDNSLILSMARQYVAKFNEADRWECAAIDERAKLKTGEITRKQSREDLFVGRDERASKTFYALQDAIIASPADTLEEAAAVLMVTINHTNILRSRESQEERDQQHDIIEAALASVLAIMQREIGIDLDQYGLSILITPRLHPQAFREDHEAVPGGAS